MGDFKLGRLCDHLIYDETLTIEGSSPNYFATLKYTSNGASNTMILREFGATEGMTNFVYHLNGFTNWNLLSDQQTIQFNTLGMGAGIASFLDGSAMIIPPPTMLATYYAHQNYCPKHNKDTNITQDISFDSRGDVKQASGTSKVRQQVVKAIVTALGANRLHDQYGSEVDSLIGEKFDLFAQMRLQQTIQNAVQFLIEEQQNISSLPMNETIMRISNLQVSQAKEDPRVFNVLVKIQVATYEEIEATLPILVGD